MVYVTRGLFEVLLRMAADAEPRPVSIPLSVTPAKALSGADDLDPGIPVFTHFYVPDAGRSITAVFGVDLSTPPASTRGRFVSHPQGTLELTRSDELHEVVLVAVPPWDEDTIAAFDRAGCQLDLDVVDAEPPGESLDAHSR